MCLVANGDGHEKSLQSKRRAIVSGQSSSGHCSFNHSEKVFVYIYKPTSKNVNFQIEKVLFVHNEYKLKLS